MDIQTIRDRVNRAAHTMPPQLRKASGVLLRNPDDVALVSMRELAARAALPPSTFVRLSRLLGFSGYSELREVFAQRLRQAPRLYSGGAERLQAREDEAEEASLLREIFTAKIDNIERTFERNSVESMVRVVKRIERARQVFLLGQRSCHPVAYFFDYVYRLFSTKAILVQDEGGAYGDKLRGIGARDVLLVVSVRPYTRNAVLAAEFAAAQKATVVAITDDELSPLARSSDQMLFIDPSSPSFFHSIVSALAMVEALLALLMARGGDAALAQLAASEEQLDRFGAYWTEAKSRRKP